MTLAYNPFLAKLGNLRIGLKPLNLATWIEIDDQWQTECQLKAELLQAQRDRVFVSLSGSETAQREVLNLLLSHLAQHFPNLIDRTGDRLYCSQTGEEWNLAEFGDRPLELASRLVQEDVCILAPQAGQYQLVAGCVCFPSRWDLRSKLGKSVFDIHEPVPHYAEALGNPVNHLFDRLRVDAPGWRLNWSIADTPDLFLPPDRPICYDGITLGSMGDRLWLRIERQTLRRLPKTQTILFTIRTYCYSLAQVAANQDTRAGLRQAIAQISPETQRYKSIKPIQAELLAHLA